MRIEARRILGAALAAPALLGCGGGGSSTAAAPARSPSPSPEPSASVALWEPDTPDPELGELPNVCAHYVIERDGTVLRVVPETIMCRHTVGLNYTAIGIEHVGFSADAVLGNDAQMRASLVLARRLQCRHGILAEDVIGHNESRSSPYHRERVAALRTQTHDDFTAAEMAVYRRRLTGSGGC